MIDLSDAPVSALLELHGDLLAGLRRRNVVRSSNNPTGDYGELLYSRDLGWTLNGNSSADADRPVAASIGLHGRYTFNHEYSRACVR
jgi:hypothetical protein